MAKTTCNNIGNDNECDSLPVNNYIVRLFFCFGMRACLDIVDIFHLYSVICSVTENSFVIGVI